MIHQWEIIQLLSKEHQAISSALNALLLRLVELVRELKKIVDMIVSVVGLSVKMQVQERVMGQPILIARKAHHVLVFMTGSVGGYMRTLLKVVGVVRTNVKEGVIIRPAVLLVSGMMTVDAVI
jgi:hypothetical protein